MIPAAETNTANAHSAPRGKADIQGARCACAGRGCGVGPDPRWLRADGGHLRALPAPPVPAAPRGRAADTRWCSAVVLGAWGQLLGCGTERLHLPSPLPGSQLVCSTRNASPVVGSALVPQSPGGWHQPRTLLPHHGQWHPLLCSWKPGEISGALREFGALFLAHKLMEPSFLSLQIKATCQQCQRC